MLKENIAELAQNPKIAISVSAASASIGAGTKWFDVASELLPLTSVLIGIMVSIVVIIVQISDLLRKNREHKIAMVKSELEIAAMRANIKKPKP